MVGASFDESAMSSRSSGKSATAFYLHNLNVICPPKLACRIVCFFPPCPTLESVPKHLRAHKRKLWMQAVVFEILCTLETPAGSCLSRYGLYAGFGKARGVIRVWVDRQTYI
jgi:hypothetical protein